MKDLQQEEISFSFTDSPASAQRDTEDFNILNYVHLLDENPKCKDKHICPNCDGNDLSINKSTGAYSCFSGCGDTKAIRRRCHELAGEALNSQHYNSAGHSSEKKQYQKPGQESSKHNESKPGFKLGRLKSVSLPERRALGNITNKKGVVQYDCFETIYKYGENQEIVRRDFFTDADCTKREKAMWCAKSASASAPQATWEPYYHEELEGQTSALWVEGEKCCNVTREKLQLVTITNRAGSEDLLIATLEKYGIERLVILPDNDAAGQTKANKLKKAAEGSKVNISLLDITKFWKDCPPAQDIADWIEHLDDQKINPGLIVEIIEKQINDDLKKKNKLKEEEDYFAKNNSYEVKSTPEQTILETVFELNQDWIVLNNSFYQYSKNSVWVLVSDVKVEKLIVENLRKLYTLTRDKDGGFVQVYNFAGERNKKNSMGFCRSALSCELPAEHNQHLIAFDNGVLDTRVGRLLPHSKDYLLTHKIEGDYQKSDVCPEFVLNYFKETLGAENINLLRAVICMVLDPSAPYGFFVHFGGQSGGGKGTLINLIQSLLPPENVSSLGTFKEVASPEKRHQYLSQARLATFEDLGGFQSEVRDFYKLVDNHPLNGRQLNNATGYTRQWNCRFLMASVLELQIENSGDGWARRVIKFKLKRRDTKKIDSQLKNKLKAYRSEIINWALSMNAEVRNELLETARFLPQMAELNAEQARNSSSVLQFIDSSLATSDDEFDVLESAVLYDNYKSFCEASRLKAFSYSLFVNHLKDRIHDHHVDAKQIRKNGKRETIKAYWKNIKFSSNSLFQSVNNVIFCNKAEFQSGGLEDFDSFSFEAPPPPPPETEAINETTAPIVPEIGSIAEIVLADNTTEVVKIVQKRQDIYTCLNQTGQERQILDITEAVCFSQKEAEAITQELGSTIKQFGFPPAGSWILVDEKLAYVNSVEPSCYVYILKGEINTFPRVKGWEPIDIKKYSEMGIRSGIHS
ncbi:MAG: hypothetical protein KME38_29060 [Spirirestis rafaelensis WJT71-NPBG6]|jgi:phage/plasmid-associated DNA primase|nr:hypothetical protein [Spirirestis rafaelensis WJT71-NPBG6]